MVDEKHERLLLEILRLAQQCRDGEITFQELKASVQSLRENGSPPPSPRVNRWRVAFALAVVATVVSAALYLAAR